MIRRKIWREQRKKTYSSLACLGGRSGIGDGRGINDDLLVLNGGSDGGFGGRHYSVRGYEGALKGLRGREGSVGFESERKKGEQEVQVGGSRRDDEEDGKGRAGDDCLGTATHVWGMR